MVSYEELANGELWETDKWWIMSIWLMVSDEQLANVSYEQLANCELWATD